MTPKQKKIAFAVAGGIAVLCVIASCSRRSDDYAYAPQPQVVAAAPQYATPAQQYAAAPVIVNQAPAAAHDGFFTGMLMGHLMSNNGGTRVEHHYVNPPSRGWGSPAPVAQNITKNVTVNKTYVQQAAPAAVVKPAPVQQRPAYVAPAQKPVATTSGYGSYGAKVTTFSVSSNKGYGSYDRGR